MCDIGGRIALSQGQSSGGPAPRSKAISVQARKIELLPVAGIAFLWFIGVLRDRLGAKEDRFRHSLLRKLTLVSRPHVHGGCTDRRSHFGWSDDRSGRADRNVDIPPGARCRVHLGEFRRGKGGCGFHDIDVHGLDPHGDRTALDRGCDYVLALILLIGSYFVTWTIVVLPMWVLLISVVILINNLRERKRQSGLN